MSCKHGNHHDSCDECEALNEAWKGGYLAGYLAGKQERAQAPAAGGVEMPAFSFDPKVQIERVLATWDAAMPKPSSTDAAPAAGGVTEASLNEMIATYIYVKEHDTNPRKLILVERGKSQTPDVGEGDA